MSVPFWKTRNGVLPSKQAELVQCLYEQLTLGAMTCFPLAKAGRVEVLKGQFQCPALLLQTESQPGEQETVSAPNPAARLVLEPTRSLCAFVFSDKPQPPAGPIKIVESSANDITIQWNPPKDDGGKPLQRYVVERQQMGKNEWETLGETPKSCTTFTTNKVEQDMSYYFRVRAVNAEGTSDALESGEVKAVSKGKEELFIIVQQLPGKFVIKADIKASSLHFGCCYRSGLESWL